MQHTERGLNRYETPLKRLRKFFGIPRPGIQWGLNSAVSRVLPSEHGPELMAKGGEHLVMDFADPKHRNLIYKVNFFDALRLFQNGQVSTTDWNLVLERMRKKIEARRGMLMKLREYVGFNAVPAQQVMIREVPITPKILKALGLREDSIPKNLPKTMPARITIQRKVELGSEDVSLNAWHPEDSAVEMDWWKEMAHTALVGGAMEDFIPEVQVEDSIRLYPELRYIRGRAENDPKFKEALKDCVTKLIAFCRDMDTAVDLVGTNNVVLKKGKDGWSPKFLDPLPIGELKISYLEKVVKVANTNKESEINWTLAMNALNTVRVLNALALISGSEERLVVPGLASLSAEYFRKKCQPYFQHGEDAN